MTYWRFLNRSLFRRKLNFLPILLLLGITIFLFFMNRSVQDKVSFVGMIEAENAVMEAAHNDYSEHLAAKAAGESQYENDDLKGMKAASETLQENLTLNKQAQELAEKSQWQEAYGIKLALIEKNEIANLQSGLLPSDDVAAIEKIYRARTLYRGLKEANVAYDPEWYEIKGVTFLYRMQDIVMPLFFTVCLITLLTNLFFCGQVEGMWLEDLFPQGKLRVQMSKILYGFILSLLIFGLVMLLSFAMASIISGVGSSQYPVVIKIAGHHRILPVGQIMGKAAVLQGLSLLLLTLSTYLFAGITKNKLITMFISIIVDAGLIAITGKIEPLFPVSHVLPTTYFNAVQVSNHELSGITNNPHINFETGALVLTISCLILLVVITLRNRYSEKSELLFRHQTIRMK